MQNKKLIIDVDNTLTVNNSSSNYKTKLPRLDVIQKLSEYRKLGYEVILYSARNMRTYNGDISKINKNTLPVLIDWLEEHSVEYDGLIVGKPWCGEGGFYVDDRAIRPDEFTSLTEQEIIDKLNSY
jgi:capsule biosynthesis phosphatase